MENPISWAYLAKALKHMLRCIKKEKQRLLATMAETSDALALTHLTLYKVSKSRSLIRAHVALTQRQSYVRALSVYDTFLQNITGCITELRYKELWLHPPPPEENTERCSRQHGQHHTDGALAAAVHTAINTKVRRSRLQTHSSVNGFTCCL